MSMGEDGEVISTLCWMKQTVVKTQIGDVSGDALRGFTML
jgi:hypothetical protein